MVPDERASVGLECLLGTRLDVQAPERFLRDNHAARNISIIVVGARQQTTPLKLPPTPSLARPFPSVSDTSVKPSTFVFYDHSHTAV